MTDAFASQEEEFLYYPLRGEIPLKGSRQVTWSVLPFSENHPCCCVMNELEEDKSRHEKTITRLFQNCSTLGKITAYMGVRW